MAKIELKNLSKNFGGNAVIQPVDLKVGEGEIFTLVGPSGCGKTTLLNLISGLEAPSSGEIFFDGKPVEHLSPRDRDVAMVFQNYALYPHKSVFENVAFPLKVRGMSSSEIKSKVGKIAQVLGLSELLSRRPSQLSGGQQQRVALARALVREPKVFLMDEPLSNLDAQLRTLMRLELKRLHKDFPVTTIYVTHDQEEAMSLSDRMAVLKGGIIQQIGTPQEVYDRPSNLFVARFMGKPSINVWEESRDGRGVLVGLRPEHVLLQAQKSSAQADGAVVEVIEPMGSECWVEVLWKGRRIVSKILGSLHVAPGQEVSLSWQEKHLHFFDPSTQNRTQ